MLVLVEVVDVLHVGARGSVRIGVGFRLGVRLERIALSGLLSVNQFLSLRFVLYEQISVVLGGVVGGVLCT